MNKEIRLLPHQYDFITSEQNTMLVAGYGSGKSHIGTIKTIYKKLQYPDKKVAYYLPTYGLIRDIAFDKFPTLLDEMGIKYRLNKSDKEIHLDNAGTIIFRSMDTPESIIGYECAYSLIDEADILPMDKMDKVYKKILGRNRAVDNANVDAVSTPEGFKWLYNQSTSGHFRVIQARTYDNKYLPLDYIKTLRSQYPKNLLEAYLNGQFVNLTSGTVYSYFNRKTHHSDEVMGDNDTVLAGADFNYSGSINIILVRRGDKIIAVDEMVSNDTKSMGNNLKEKFKGHSISVYPDASGNNHKTNADHTDIQILRQFGLNVFTNASNPSIVGRVNTVNNLFEKGKLLINTKKCPELTRALEQQAWDIKTQLPEKRNEHPEPSDYVDSLGYCIAYLFPILTPMQRVAMSGH